MPEHGAENSQGPLRTKLKKNAGRAGASSSGALCMAGKFPPKVPNIFMSQYHPPWASVLGGALPRSQPSPSSCPRQLFALAKMALKNGVFCCWSTESWSFQGSDPMAQPPTPRRPTVQAPLACQVHGRGTSRPSPHCKFRVLSLQPKT